jgi:hypothetical protein
MTRKDIIRMARETAVQSPRGDTNVWVFGDQELGRFAALVAAAEREACAQACEQACEQAGACPRCKNCSSATCSRSVRTT